MKAREFLNENGIPESTSFGIKGSKFVSIAKLLEAYHKQASIPLRELPTEEEIRELIHQLSQQVNENFRDGKGGYFLADGIGGLVTQWMGNKLSDGAINRLSTSNKTSEAK